MSNHGRLNRDGIFNNLQIGTKMAIDSECNAILGDVVVKGSMDVKGAVSGVASEWAAVILPDTDQPSWVPANRTRYFQSGLTATRTITLSQGSMNAAYPMAADGTLIEFDFVFSENEYLDLEVTDLNGVYLNNSISPPRTFDAIVHMKGGYVVKESGSWHLVMPDLRYD